MSRLVAAYMEKLNKKYNKLDNLFNSSNRGKKKVLMLLCKFCKIYSTLKSGSQTWVFRNGSITPFSEEGGEGVKPVGL